MAKQRKEKKAVAEAGEVVKFDEAGMPQLEVWLEDETIWLTQKQMAELFGCAMENIIHHLKNIYTEEELIEEATTKEFLVVRFEGKRQVSRKVKHYNLDAIISVGYRVNSKRGVKFRQWYPPRKRGSRFVASQAERKRVPSNIGLEGISVARACARPEDWQVGEAHDGCRTFDRHHHLYADARIAGEPRANRVSGVTTCE